MSTSDEARAAGAADATPDPATAPDDTAVSGAAGPGEAPTPGPTHPGEEAPAERAGVGRLVAIALATTIAAAFVLVALVAPYLGTGPRNVPVGVAGEKSSTAQIEQLLTTLQPGAFHVTTYPDADALRAATLHREVYGGFAVEGNSPTAVVATGASPIIGQFLSNIGNSLGATVDNVAPGSSRDSSGYGLHVGATVAALAAVAGAVLIARTAGRRLSAQVAGALALAVVLGVGVAAALQALGSVEGVFLQVAAVTAVAVLAVEAVVLGLVRLGGLVAAGLFTLLIIVPGISLSGLTSAPEMLPSPFGAIGQLLPEGAYGRLVQSVAYFGGGGALRPILVLLGWLVLGALLVWLGHAREGAAARRRATDAQIAALEAEGADEENAPRGAEAGGAEAGAAVPAAGGAQVAGGAPAAGGTPSTSTGTDDLEHGASAAGGTPEMGAGADDEHDAPAAGGTSTGAGRTPA